MKNDVLVEIITYLCLVLGLLLILFGLFSLIIHPLLTLEILNDFGVTTIIIGIVSLMGVIIVFTIEKSRYNLSQIKEQIKLLDALHGELTIISSCEIPTYYKCVKGNIEWYEEMLKTNDLEKIKTLDHPINKLSFGVYITKFDKSICKRL